MVTRPRYGSKPLYTYLPRYQSGHFNCPNGFGPLEYAYIRVTFSQAHNDSSLTKLVAQESRKLDKLTLVMKCYTGQTRNRKAPEALSSVFMSKQSTVVKWSLYHLSISFVDRLTSQRCSLITVDHFQLTYRCDKLGINAHAWQGLGLPNPWVYPKGSATFFCLTAFFQESWLSSHLSRIQSLSITAT